MPSVRDRTSPYGNLRGGDANGSLIFSRQTDEGRHLSLSRSACPVAAVGRIGCLGVLRCPLLSE